MMWAVWGLLGVAMLCIGMALVCANLDRNNLEQAAIRSERERADLVSQKNLMEAKLEAEELVLRQMKRFIERGAGEH